MKLTFLIPLLLIVEGLAAQQTVAPTPEGVGPARGQTHDGYNVTNSFELGYRFRSVGGDAGKYRSDVNFGNGVRLLGSSLGVNSTGGHGRLFDYLSLTTQGLGNDPYQFSSLRAEKNGLYRYQMLWRLSDYVNPGLTGLNDRHFLNTQRRLQDHDLTLFPQSGFRLFLGYTRNVQDGPALTSVNLFGSSGDEFPLFAGVRRERNEYRLGAEIRVSGLRLNLLRGWDDFKEDTPVSLTGTGTGGNPADLAALASLTRLEPYHGTSPYWRVNILSEQSRWLAVNGRFTYTMGRRDFVFDEAASGTSRFGAAFNRQTLVSGNGRRPVLTGSFTLTLFPTSKLTVSNQTAMHNVRMEGDSAFREFNNAVGAGVSLYFNFLGLRTIANTTDVNYRAAPWIGLYGGYHYSTRRVRSVEQFEAGAGLERLPAAQENRIHSGLAGLRLHPLKPLTISVDGELGRANRPFFPIGERNYHGLNARARYKARSLTLSAAAQSSYNTNSVSLSSHSSRSRNYFCDVSWTLTEWFSFDGSYSKLHLDTASGLFYFALSQSVPGERSIYTSNIHAGTFGAHVAVRKVADVFLGYSHVQDTGDGRATAVSGAAPGVPAFLAAQTFPVAFRSPAARLSVRLHEKLRWNFGYQHYGYREDFSMLRNYRAHTGYTSVLWSF